MSPIEVGQETDVRVFAVEFIKGLEFESVFFVGVDRLMQTYPDLYDKYLYVGATRAATYLGFTCEESLPVSRSALRSLFVGRWSSNPVLERTRSPYVTPTTSIPYIL